MVSDSEWGYRALFEKHRRFLPTAERTRAIDQRTGQLRRATRHSFLRRGEERVRALLGEEERLSALRLHEARAAFDLGRFDAARRHASEALGFGADPDAVQTLFDRLDERTGRLASHDGQATRPPLAPSGPVRGGGFSRTALLGAWVLAMGLVLGVVVSSWERIVDRLARAPWPTSRLTPSSPSAPESSADTALVEARRLLTAGQVQGALRALDRISARDPNYPYARRLRAEAESALASPEATR